MLRVTAALIEFNDKILIARRKVGKHLEGYWEFPGGKIEIGETPEQCLRRELFEEFGIETEIGDFIAESVFSYSDFTVQLLGYRTKWVSGDFKLVDHDKIEWVSLKQMRNYTLAPADLPILAAYEKLNSP